MVSPQPPHALGRPPVGSSRRPSLPFIPMIVLAIVVVAVIGWLVGLSDGNAHESRDSESTTGSTTPAELCAAYRDANAVSIGYTDGSPAAIGPAMRRLAAAARGYPDAAVQTDVLADHAEYALARGLPDEEGLVAGGVDEDRQAHRVQRGDVGRRRAAVAEAKVEQDEIEVGGLGEQRVDGVGAGRELEVGAVVEGRTQAADDLDVIVDDADASRYVGRWGRVGQWVLVGRCTLVGHRGHHVRLGVFVRVVWAGQLVRVPVTAPLQSWWFPLTA